MKTWIARAVVPFVVLTFIIAQFSPAGSQSGSAFADLTPNQLTFTGRRGASYTAAWDPSTGSITFTTPDSTFPWDWISFVGQAGAVALNGYPNVGATMARADPTVLDGAAPGDLLRVKGSGVLGLAQLTKSGW